MGIDYSGGMLVGCHGSDFSISEDCPSEVWDDLSEGEDWEDIEHCELLEYLEMEQYHEHYDSGMDHSYVGYEVPNVPISSPEFDLWLADVKDKARKFEGITGVEAKLIGTQNIW